MAAFSIFLIFWTIENFKSFENLKNLIGISCDKKNKLIRNFFCEKLETDGRKRRTFDKNEHFLKIYCNRMTKIFYNHLIFFTFFYKISKRTFSGEEIYVMV